MSTLKHIKAGGETYLSNSQRMAPVMVNITYGKYKPHW